MFEQLPSLRFLIILVQTTTLICATPLPPDSQNREAFTLAQVERGTYIKNGAYEIARTYAKYGVWPSGDLLAAAAAREEEIQGIFASGYGYDEPKNGTAPAVPRDEWDTMYLTPVTCGANAMQLDFDTGSSDLWTFSNLIPQPLLKDHDYYDVSTGKELRNHTFAIRYGDGSYAYGKVYTDKVTVGGLTVPSQAIGAARSVSTTFLRDKQNDGMFGLGFSSGNTVKPTKQMTFFDNIKGELLEPLFAVALKHHAVGSYDFGYIDKSKYVGDITYADVNNTRGFWEFSVEGYQVGPRTDKRPVYRPFSAIGDTGTTLIYLPTDVCKAYYEHVPGAALVPSEGGWVFPCSAVLPDISFSIGLDFNMKQTVPGHYLKYAPVSSGSSQCFGGIQAVPLSLGFGIIGDTFLKSKYVIHEFRDDRPRLGFAQQTGV